MNKQKGLLSKILVVGVITLFIGVGVQPAIADTINNKISTTPKIFGKIIYVDDDNTEGPWDGTKEYPYRKIKVGVNAADKGDTVFVYSGLYEEGWINIEKHMKVIGENKNTTIVNGSGYEAVFNIWGNSNFVTIRGFTIKNSRNQWPLFNPAGILVRSNCNIISGNRIIGNNHGIWVYGWFNFISGNVFMNNEEAGVYITGDNQFNIIFGNHFENNDYGVLMRYDPCFSFIIKNNFVNNGQNAYFFDSTFNRWIRNYWDDNINGPYRIEGKVILGFPNQKIITVYNHDWFPRKEPYDIDV